MSSITSKTPTATASAPSLRVRDPNYVERIKAAFGRQGFLRLIEGRVDEVAPGRCVIVADFRTALAQQHGFFHGGLIGTLADTAGACAASTLLESRQWLLTAEYKINFLAPAKGVKLKAVGEVVRAGRHAQRIAGASLRHQRSGRSTALRGRHRHARDPRRRSAGHAERLGRVLAKTQNDDGDLINVRFAARCGRISDIFSKVRGNAVRHEATFVAPFDGAILDVSPRA
jgi:uncharacterized protein (TIGR00369 family)